MRIAGLLLGFTLAAHSQWTIQDSHTTASLRGIDSVGNGVAWASGTEGTVLRTEDGGSTWQRCAVPPGAEALDFRGVQAFDAKTAIVMSSGKGDLSRLYRTTDGCRTWKLAFTNPDKDGFWDCFWMHATGYGVLLGDPVNNRFAFFETSDSGKTWRRDDRDGLRVTGKPIAAFAASNSLFSQFRNGYMRGFVTGGLGGAFFIEAFHSQKWSRHRVPVGAASDSSGVFSLAYRFSFPKCTDCQHPSDQLLVAVGGDYSKPVEGSRSAAWSTDLGKTWQSSSTQPHGYRSAVAYDATTKTWITVGPNGTDISTDDGRNWRALQPLPGEAPDTAQHWNALSLPFVVGPKGRIGKLEPEALQATAK